jgi:hypothetical protein
MSIARTVKSSFNLDRMAAAAIKLGFKVDRDAIAYGYYTGHNNGLENNRKFPLVIRGKQGRFDIGVTEEGLCTDMHGGYVQNDLNQILPNYYSTAAEDAGFSVMSQNETKDEIVLTISR